MTLLKINRLLPIYISIVPLKFEVDIQSQSKVRVRKPKNPIWPPVTSLKINRLLPMATINMHMKFEIEIPKQTWLMLQKPCRLQTDGQTDRRTDGQKDKVNPVYPPSNFVGRGYNNLDVMGCKYENLDSDLYSTQSHRFNTLCVCVCACCFFFFFFNRMDY